MKKCSKCGLEKPLQEFPRCARNRDWHKNYCFLCRPVKDVKRSKYNPHTSSRRQLRALYGITPEDKAELVKEQGGRCAICRDVFLGSRTTHTDHIHGSEPPVIRGILCAKCNQGIGLFKDSPERMLLAVEYLKKFQR